MPVPALTLLRSASPDEERTSAVWEDPTDPAVVDPALVVARASGVGPAGTQPMPSSREPDWVVETPTADSVDDDDATVALLWRHDPRSRVGSFARRHGPPRAVGPARRIEPATPASIADEDTGPRAPTESSRRAARLASPAVAHAAPTGVPWSPADPVVTSADLSGAALFVLGAVSALMVAALLWA